MKNSYKINCSKDVSYILEMIREGRGVGPVEFCRSIGTSYNTYYKRLDFGKHHRGYQLDNFINIMNNLGYDVCIIPQDDNLEVLE